MIRSFIRGSLLIPIVGLLLPAASDAAPDSGAPTRLNYGGNTSQLERSWNDLNRQLNSLDTLLGPAPDPDPSDNLTAPQLPADLLDANRQANEELSQKDSIPDAPLSLPGSADQDIKVKSVSLKQAIAIAFRNNPELQIQRERIAAQGATVASLSGSYWPTISVFADVEGFQTGSTTFSPYGNNTYGFGPVFAAKGQTTNFAVINTENKIKRDDGPFYVPPGGGLYADSNGIDSLAGLQLNYALIDFARTPRVRSAYAKLQQFEQQYANQLRALQLEVSEAYYQLQLNEQLVRIRDAVVRTDLIVLEDTLNLKQAGLVPRVDLLRRSATLATDQEELIQALADRAVSRRELWTLLNLPAEVIPSADDSITLAPAWPLSLEQSLLAAYDSNPELDAILATRRALALQQDETAAQLLPKLSLFASVGGMASVERTFNFSLVGGGCCGATFLPLEQVAGYDWSVGLAFNWMIFNAGATANAVKALSLREQAASQSYAATRNSIRLRLERAFLNHEASLAKLVSARRAVGASKEAFRDSTLRYRTGLTNEVDLSVTQTQLVDSLVNRLIATVDVNVTYAQLLRELLPMPKDPDTEVPAELTLEGFSLRELNRP